MKDIFILGSGFSKAISENSLPTMDEMTIDIIDLIKNSKETIFQNIFEDYISPNNIGNIEDILTLLYQDYPWKPESEKHLFYSLYVFISKTIASYLEEKEKNSPTVKNKKSIQGTPIDKDIPPDLMDPNLVIFIKYLHKNNVPLITFNYDTVFDDACRMVIDKYYYPVGPKKITCDHFYRMPLMRLHKIHRSARDLFDKFEDTLILNKLHGSINWYHYGTDSDQIFLTSGFYTNIESVSKAALIPLIIPPVYDKSGFLKINAIRSIWVRARIQLEEAERIFIIGYSLPKSDLTVRLMLKMAINPNAKVFIIDNNYDSKDFIKANYKEILKSSNILSTDFIKKDNVISEFMGKYVKNLI